MNELQAFGAGTHPRRPRKCIELRKVMLCSDVFKNTQAQAEFWALRLGGAIVSYMSSVAADQQFGESLAGLETSFMLTSNSDSKWLKWAHGKSETASWTDLSKPREGGSGCLAIPEMLGWSLYRTVLKSLTSWFGNVTRKDALYHPEINNRHSDVTDHVEYVQPFTYVQFQTGVGRNRLRFTETRTAWFGPYSPLRTGNCAGKRSPPNCSCLLLLLSKTRPRWAGHIPSTERLIGKELIRKIF